MATLTVPLIIENSQFFQHRHVISQQTLHLYSLESTYAYVTLDSLSMVAITRTVYSESSLTFCLFNIVFVFVFLDKLM